MARTYINNKRIHVYISEDLNDLIQANLIEGESRTAFIQKCVLAYLDKEKLNAPVTKLEHEHVIKYYFQKYFGEPLNQPLPEKKKAKKK